MICADKTLGSPVNVFAKAVSAHHPIYFFLIRAVARIIAFCTPIKVNPMTTRFRPVIIEPIHNRIVCSFVTSDIPVSRHTRSTAVDIWVFGQGIRGDQTAHTRTHDERGLPVRLSGVVCVYKGF